MEKYLEKAAIKALPLKAYASKIAKINSCSNNHAFIGLLNLKDGAIFHEAQHQTKHRKLP